MFVVVVVVVAAVVENFAIDKRRRPNDAIINRRGKACNQ
jgi:hypothetical protein